MSTHRGAWVGLLSIGLAGLVEACAVADRPAGWTDASPGDVLEAFDAPVEVARDVDSDAFQDAATDASLDAATDAATDPLADSAGDVALADAPGDPIEDPMPGDTLDAPGDSATDALVDLPLDVPHVLPWLPAAPGGFRRIGDALVDDQGRSVVLHGVNASNVAKYRPDRLTWQSAEDFAQLAAAGFNNVRLLTFWGALMPDKGVIDTAYLEAFAQRVQWAVDAGLIVVIDMHQDIFGFGFGDNGAPAWACDQANYDAYVPRQPWYLNYLSPEVRACFDRFYVDDELFGHFVDAWRAVAQRFKDHPGVLGFDILNEPNPASADAARFVPDLWQPRQEQVAAALTAIAPDRLVFFQGATLLAVGVVDEFVPSPSPQVAFAPHYYLPTIHDGGVYDPDGMVDYVDTAFDAVATSAANLGHVPVWMGEWGGPIDIPGFDRYLEDLLTRFVQRRWSWSIYSDDRNAGSGFGIRNDDGSFNAMVVQRLSHPHARAVPGPVSDQSLAFLADGRQIFTSRFSWRSPSAALDLWTGAAGGRVGCRLVPPGGDVRACDSFACPQAPALPAGCLRACRGPEDPDGDWTVELDWQPAASPSAPSAH